MGKIINIAIDGPAGAGKSTISKNVSAKLGFIYVDTGALYRAVALYRIKNNLTDDNQLIESLENCNIELKFVDNAQRVYLNGEDVSTEIRQNEVSMIASSTSAIPKVREFLFELQQKTARENNVIMDGRDIGTVVLPNADIKIFLTATPEDRAKRRYDELVEKTNGDYSYEQILSEIKERDYNDSHREIAPLKQADDAILVDTTGFELEQAIEKLYSIIKNAL